METSDGEGARDPSLMRVVSRAVSDLVGREGMPASEVEVVEARSVVWPDGGLGCPAPGMRYKQVPVEGALVRLRARGREYEYHAGGERGLVLCPRSQHRRNT